MNSTYYPSKARYFLTFRTAYTKWLKLQGLPPSLVQHLQPFLEHQWRLHNMHLKQQPRFTARLLRQLQEYLGQHTLLHHADHELLPYCAPATNGASAKISTFLTESFTSKRRSNGRKAAPLSHISSHSVATYSASPAGRLTLSFNIFTPNTPAKCPFPNFGAIFTVTSPKPHQTFHCTLPTMTSSASSTRSHNTDSSMLFTLSSNTGNNSNPHTP